MSWWLDPYIFSSVQVSRLGGNYFVRGLHESGNRAAGKEEILRSMACAYLAKMLPAEHEIKTEYPIAMGITTKRADIVVTRANGIVMIAEVKQEADENTEEQLLSYLAATQAEKGAIFDKDSLQWYNRVGYGLAKSSPPEGWLDKESSPVNVPSVTLSELLDHGRFVRLNYAANSFTVPTKSLVTYSKVLKAALVAGVRLPGFNKRSWEEYYIADLHPTLQEMLKNTPEISHGKSGGDSAISRHTKRESFKIGDLHVVGHDSDDNSIKFESGGKRFSVFAKDVLVFARVRNAALRAGLLLPACTKNDWDQFYIEKVHGHIPEIVAGPAAALTINPDPRPVLCGAEDEHLDESPIQLSEQTPDQIVVEISFVGLSDDGKFATLKFHDNCFAVGINKLPFFRNIKTAALLEGIELPTLKQKDWEKLYLISIYPGFRDAQKSLLRKYNVHGLSDAEVDSFLRNAKSIRRFPTEELHLVANVPTISDRARNALAKLLRKEGFSITRRRIKGSGARPRYFEL